MPSSRAIRATGSRPTLPGVYAPPMANAKSRDKPGYNRVHIRS